MSDEIDKLEKELGQKEDRLNDRRLFLYFAQLGHSVYTGKPIDIERLEKDYDIDHIIPRAKYEDDSFGNTVLVEQALNRNKSDVYPIEPTILTEGGRQWIQYLEQWSAANKIKFMSAEKARRLLRVEPLSEDELVGFVNRQIVATSQATTGIANLLRKTDPNSRVVFSKADRVSDFRKEFDMMKCREVNDFHHAKDAYLNIVVGNVYNTKFTDNFFRSIRTENYSLNRVFDYDVPNAWKADGTSISTVKKYMAMNTPIITVSLKEGKGVLFKQQPLKKGKGQFPIKKGWAISRYGGYDSIFGSYFCVVEHQKGKKRVRTIEPNGVNLKSGWRLFSSADNLTTVRGNEIIPEARIKNNF